MNKNSLDDLKNGKGIFENKFCKGKFNSKKCQDFYRCNSPRTSIELVKCPYGYACIFSKNSVISSIINKTYSDYTSLYKRHCYSKRNNQQDDFLEISDEEVNNFKSILSYEIKFNALRDTFHDLKNNHRYIKNSSEFVSDENVKKFIEKMNNIYSNHQVKIINCTNEKDKYDTYVNEIIDINDIISELINNPSVIKQKELLNNIEFADYRIRYLLRIVSNQDYHRNEYIKKLNIISILTKLKYTLNTTIKKKEQKISFSFMNENDVIIDGYDDIFLAFFILLENASKYAPFQTIIDVSLNYKENHQLLVEIKNESNEINGIEHIFERGFQGANKKDGQGLGLSIAKDIFDASGFDLHAEYLNGYFLITVSKIFKAL